MNRTHHVGEQGNEAAGDYEPPMVIALVSARLGSVLQAQFKSHHEVDPGPWIALEGIEDGLAFVALDTVGAEDLVDLLFLFLGPLDDFTLFAKALAARSARRLRAPRGSRPAPWRWRRRRSRPPRRAR